MIATASLSRTCLFVAALALFWGVATSSQTIVITSPADQSHRPISGASTLSIQWQLNTSCTFITNIMEVYVNGRVQACSGDCSGSAGTLTLDPGNFFGDCTYTVQLKAVVRREPQCNPITLITIYSPPITLYDSNSPYSGCEGICAAPEMGGPVNVATGNMWYQQEDLRIEGPLPLVFARRYVHKNASSIGPLGYGWTHSYNWTLSFPTGQIVLRNSEGRDIRFTALVSGGYAVNRRHHLTLTTITGGYRVTTKDQTKYNFDSSGRLTSIVDRNSNTVTLAYDGSNRLSTITDPFGRAFTLSYDGSNRIQSITDGTRTVTYGYDGAGDLRTVTDATLHAWTHGYDGSHRLQTVTDPEGHLVEGFSYDGSNRVQTFYRQGGEEGLTFNYASATQTQVTDSLSHVTTITLDQYNGVATAITGPGCQACGQGTNESYQYDGYLNKTQITDGNGNVTRQTFDTTYWGDMLTRTEAFGTALARTTTYTYHSTYHFIASVTVPSVDTGGQNRVQTYTYDVANGNLLTETLAGYSNGSPFAYTTTYTCNGHGLPLTINGPRTDVTDLTTLAYYAYDDADPAKRGRVHTVTNALSHVTTVNAYTLSGKPTETVDENAVERDEAYDALDRLTEVTIRGAIPADDITTAFTLDDDGLPVTLTLPNGNTATYTYDPLHRLTEVTDQAGNKTVYTYDSQSRKTREEFKDTGGTVRKFTNYAYDAYNRLQYVYFNATVPPTPGSIYWEYGYDNAGNQTFQKDPLGHLTCFEYDALNRKTHAHQYLGTAPGVCLATCTPPGCTDLLTQYGYDTQDHVTSVTSPAGLITTYGVDDAGKVIEQVSPDTGTTTYTFDPAGNHATKMSANGIAETRAYDALNRLTGISYPDTSNNVTYSYDSPTVSFGVGRRTGMEDPAGASVFCYDRVGHLTEEDRTPAGQPNAITGYAFDKNGNLTGVTYPSGRTVAFACGTSDEVTGASALVNGASVSIASSFAYEPFGPRTSVTFANGLVDARAFDTRYRLQTWTLGGLISKTYAWQDDDNIMGITDNLNAANNRSFGYDEIHRLITANGPWGTGGYTYDANGNRLTKTEGATNVSYSYYAGTNRLQTATGSEPGSYTYDSNGNTTGDGTRTYEYSQRDRLATVDAGTTATYSYDGDGRRVRKVAGGATTLFFFDPEGKLLEELNPATGEGKDYLWIPGSYEPLARVDFTQTDADTGDVLRNAKASPNVHLDWSLFSGSGSFSVRRGIIGAFSSYVNLETGYASKTFDDPVLGDGRNYWYDIRDRVLTDTLYFYHADHLGTPIAMTNVAASLVWRAEHFPFGGIHATPVSSIQNNLRFPGQYRDTETDLAQNWWRNYYSTVGRYQEPDPLNGPPGFTPLSCSSSSMSGESSATPPLQQPYVYSTNQPLTKYDPTGLLAKVCCRLLRPLGGGTGPFRHCYIWVDGHTWGLYPKDTPAGKVGVPIPDDPRDSGGGCKSTPDCGGQKNCIDNAAKSYPVGNYESKGRNSNTFAGYIARKCGLNTPVYFNDLDAPGWNNLPPSK